MKKFTHLDAEGSIKMVDVGSKQVTNRWAKAEARLRVSGVLFEMLKHNSLEKGDAVTAAKIAGIQAAKKTADLIPLCHPLAITSVDVEISLEKQDTVIIRTTVRARDATGVEMEALTAAATAALTLYDMGKAVDRSIVIEEIKLMEKGGGKSGLWRWDKND